MGYKDRSSKTAIIQRSHVRTEVLDEYIRRTCLERVGFIKLYAEDAEKDILEGSRELLSRRPSPVLLLELCDSCTRAWAYESREIVDELTRIGHRIFNLQMDGNLTDAEPAEVYERNVVPVPDERLAQTPVTPCDYVTS